MQRLDCARWGDAGIYTRWAPAEGSWGLAARAEHFEDKRGAISGARQILEVLTATLEHRPVESLLLRLEGRFDHSTAAVFAGDEVDAESGIVREQDQFLLLLGAVTTF